MSVALPRIAVIGTGGTISSHGLHSLDTLDYPEFGSKLTVAELLTYVEETSRVADASPVPFRSVGSTAIGPADWVALRDLIQETAARDSDLAGIVILHGTATLEETAFFLDLTLAVPQPVVLVGAQRPMSALGTDAGANLVTALRVAGSEAARGLGVLVVLNDEIHAARDVVKTSTYRVQTFRSADFGALGHVDGDTVWITRAPNRRHAPGAAFAGAPFDALPRVDIVLSYAGADGTMVEAAMAAGAPGIVSAGLAPGIPTPRGARGAGTRRRRRGVRGAVQPRSQRPCRASALPAGGRLHPGRGFQPAEGARPADVGADAHIGPAGDQHVLRCALARARRGERSGRQAGTGTDP
jgi:L-asparaginase